MVCTEIIREFTEQDAIKKNFLDPVLSLLTNINKYTTIPVYLLQVLIDKTTYFPKYVATAYDSINIMTNTAASIPHLEDIVHHKLPKTITPSVIVYPEDIETSEVLYKKSERYVYSTAFLVSGKELKDALKNESILITKVTIKSDKARKIFQVDICWTDNVYDDVTKLPVEQPTMISPITEALEPLHLPFSNYAKQEKQYESIVNCVSSAIATGSVVENGQGYAYTDKNEGKEIIESLVTNVKEENMIVLPDGKTNLFKDFIKVKPASFRYWACNSKVNDSVEVRNVCLELYIKSAKVNALIFYRYYDNLVEEIVGKYKKIEESSGEEIEKEDKPAGD